MKRLAMLAPALLLISCGVLKNKDNPSNLDLGGRPSNFGTIIISTGAPTRCISSATRLWILSVDRKKPTHDAMLNVDGSATKSDFADHQGSINAVNLPAGNYRMIPWAINPMETAIKTPEATFSLSAGETLYLGEYFMPSSCSFSNRVVFRDQRERDLALAVSRNPGLTWVNVVTRIPQFTKP